MAGGWKNPVAVHAGKDGGTRWLVGDAVRASEVLLKHWPRHATPGPKHLEARERMLACLMGKCDPEEARAAFVEAAREAGILAK